MTGWRLLFGVFAVKMAGFSSQYLSTTNVKVLTSNEPNQFLLFTEQ